jgi:hypothetical protein
MNRHGVFYCIFATLIINLFFCSPSTAGVQKGHANSYSNGISMSIAINDWAEPSVFSQSDPVSVAVNFEPGDYAGVPADWWLLAVVPSGECYYPDGSRNVDWPRLPLPGSAGGAVCTFSIVRADGAECSWAARRCISLLFWNRCVEWGYRSIHHIYGHIVDNR